MTPKQEKAVQAARDLIARRGQPGRHQVAAAIETGNGLYLGLNLECRMARATICAEAAALAEVTRKETDPAIEFCVAVNLEQEILPPCGVCRELLADFAPSAEIALPSETGQIEVWQLSRLLPRAYRSGERGLANR